VRSKPQVSQMSKDAPVSGISLWNFPTWGRGRATHPLCSIEAILNFQSGVWKNLLQKFKYLFGKVFLRLHPESSLS